MVFMEYSNCLRLACRLLEGSGGRTNSATSLDDPVHLLTMLCYK
jgi:hypothetical protein